MTSIQMRAAVLYETGRPLVIECLDVPALQRGQVLVEIAASGVCRSQLMEVRGGRGIDRWLPHLLGHEGAGVVVDIGEGVTKVSAGDSVVLTWIRSAGIDAPGPSFRRDGTTINAGPVTTFGTHAIVAENRVVRLPAGVPLDVAVLFGCALPTGAGMVLRELNPSAGSSIAVFGLGGVGLSALMASKLCGCTTIVAVDVVTDKLDAARRFGATHCVDAREQDPVSAIRELSGGGVDYSVDAGGQVATIEQAFESVRPKGGRCIFASHPPAESRISLDPHSLINGKNIAGSWGGGTDPDADIPALASLYLEGSLPLEALLARRYRLEEVNQALDDLDRHQVFRPLLVMS